MFSFSTLPEWLFGHLQIFLPEQVISLHADIMELGEIHSIWCFPV